MKELLRSVAHEAVATAPDDMGDMLERRLLPLLEAGQDMREHIGYGAYTGGGKAWDAALAAAKERQT
jgi:hypothetical protein